LAFCQRQIRAVRRPFTIVRRPNRGFPTEVKTLGAALRVASLSKSIKQRQLAHILGVPAKQLTDWVLDRQIPSATQLEAITKVLDLPDAFKTSNTNS
jgi:DNA-binding transcriptional regulator YiaG